MTYSIEQIVCDKVSLPPIPQHLVHGIYGEGDNELIRYRLIHWLSRAAGFMPKSQPMRELQVAALKHHVDVINNLQGAENPIFSKTLLEVDSDD